MVALTPAAIGVFCIFAVFWTQNTLGSRGDQVAGAAMPRSRRARLTCIGNHRPPFGAATLGSGGEHVKR
jgi:hypothetical protein